MLILGFYGKMEMKGLKENRQDKKGKLEHWKLTQNSPKQAHSKGTRPGKFTPEKLDFFSSNSPKQVITRLDEKSLSPNPIRLNMRCEA